MPSRPSRSSGARGFPRSARVNEILREVLADQLERMEDIDERLGMLTITAVQCEPDLRHATVLLSSLSEEEEAALAAVRVRLQAAISSQVRLKRTPQLRFMADPAVAAGQRIEEILRGLPETSSPEGESGSPEGESGSPEGESGAGTSDAGAGASESDSGAGGGAGAGASDGGGTP